MRRGNDDEYNRSMAARAAGADAAEVARLTELANMGRIPVTTAPLVVTTALGTTTASTLASRTVMTTTVTTTSPVSTMSTTYSIPRMVTNVLNKRQVVQEMDQAPKKPRLSSLLLKEDLPEGYTPEMVDALDDLTAVNTIKDRQLRRKKLEKRNRPGVRPGFDSLGEIPVTELEAGRDNSKDMLHPARFLPPIVEPELSKFWHLVAEKHLIEVPSWMEKRLGTSNQIPPSTFMDRHDRSLALEAKHYIEANFHIDKASDKTTAKINKGFLEMGEKEPDYMEPRTVHDLISSLLNMMATDFQLWEKDHTAMTIFRVALEFDFFALAHNQKHRVEIFNRFIKNVLSHNARYFKLPPLDYDGIKDVAVVLLRQNKISTLPVADHRYVQQLTSLGDGRRRNFHDDYHGSGRDDRGDRGDHGDRGADRRDRGGDRRDNGDQVKRDSGPAKGRMPRDIIREDPRARVWDREGRGGRWVCLLVWPEAHAHQLPAEDGLGGC